MIKIILFLLITCFLGGCAQRSLPPEHVICTPSQVIRPPMMDEVIIVDAGHGGKDAGTSSRRDKYQEKELTLETARLTADCLKKLGYKTVLTRTEDLYVPLDTRAEIANDQEADLFVSIHYNFSVSQEVEGVEVYYYKEEKKPSSQRIIHSKELATEVLRRIIDQTGAASRGLKQANFAVIRQTKMPAILIEAGFLSNPKEREKIQDAKYVHALAQGIANGIDRYLTAKRLASAVEARPRRDSNARPAA